MATTDPFAASGGGVKLAGGGWVPKDHPLAKQAPQQATAPVPPPAQPPPSQHALQSPTTAGQQIQPGTPTTVAGAFQQSLVNQLTAPPVTAQSPELQPAIAANRAAEQRGLERNQAQLAEMAAAQGIDPTALGTLTRGLIADSAQRQGQFAAQAVMQGAAQRAAQLQAALGLAGGLLSDQDRMMLQRELAELQAQLQREGLSLQGALGAGDLSLRRDLGTGQLNLGLLGTLLSNQQFGQGLAAQTALGQAGLNQQMMLALIDALT